MDNRIIGVDLIEWRKIKPLQPANFKQVFNYKHLEQSILSNGFAMPFFVWKDDKANGNPIYTIDGHTRIEVLSNMDGVPDLLPAIFLKANNKKEAIRLLLEVYNQKQNPIDTDSLKEFLIDEDISIDEVNIDAINQKIELENIDEVDNQQRDIDDAEGGKDEDFFVPDCIYPSNNIYDIPTLKLDMQGTYPDLPLKPYGAESRINGAVGTYHFYVDDYRFEGLWKSPANIIKSNCKSIVEPNLSLFDTTPISYGLFLIYKKRWLSRFFQEKGIKVFADLNVSVKFLEYNRLGIPDGYNAFFTRGYSGRLPYLVKEHQVAKDISGLDNPNLVVYGGGKEIKKYCADNNLTYIQDFINDKIIQ